MAKKFFLTGKPRVGKTTLIKKLLLSIPNAGGFYTEEVREGKERKGFKIVTLEGKEGILAHVRFKNGPRVGKYGVNIEDLEKVGVRSIEDALQDPSREWVIIDEIGKMEWLSGKFQIAVKKALDSTKGIVATISPEFLDFLEEGKKREVEVISLTPGNRDKIYFRKGGLRMEEDSGI